MEPVQQERGTREKPRKIMLEFEPEQTELPVFITVTTESHSYVDDGVSGDYYTICDRRKDAKLVDEQYDCILVAQSDYQSIEDIDPVLLAYITGEREKEKALQKVDKYSGDNNIVLSCYLRVGDAKQFIKGGIDNVVD